MLEGKKILIGVTGSIAAYKIAWLVRLLVKARAEVKVIMTPSATTFISPLTLSTLSKNEVLSQLSENSSWSNHVMLGRWADVMLVAPLSCNTLSKMASGGCDNLLLAVYLSATCPVMVAPAMDEDMWLHPSTQANLEKLKSFNNIIIPVNNGELASGLSGEGRMAEPEEIIALISRFLETKKSLAGKKILVSAGPTHEALDPVRFLGNASTGKMGIAIAGELQDRGAEVNLVLGPSSEKVRAGIKVIRVKSAQEMYEACLDKFTTSDWAIMSAAVADYTPSSRADKKIKKDGEILNLELVKTPDILKKLGEMKQEHQCLVGFALETDNERENAIKKMHAKNADLIVLNSLNDVGAGFGYDTNQVSIFDRSGGEINFEKKSKAAVAADIVNTIINYTHE